jgi:hypothetical protein
VNDNDAGYKEMHFVLMNNFNQIKLEDRYAFFHEVIGGLRFEEQINLKLARYLRDIYFAISKWCFASNRVLFCWEKSKNIEIMGNLEYFFNLKKDKIVYSIFNLFRNSWALNI